MSTTEVIGIISGIVGIAALPPYVRGMLREGGNRPNPLSWWIWTVVGIITASTYFKSGARDTMWLAVVYVIGPLTVAILSIKYGEKGWDKYDTICLTGAIASLIVWAVTTAFTAHVMCLVLDMFGAVKVAQKSYNRPKSENFTGWAITFAASAINMFAIESFTLKIALYPTYALLGNGAITVILFVREKVGRKRSTA